MLHHGYMIIEIFYQLNTDILFLNILYTYTKNIILHINNITILKNLQTILCVSFKLYYIRLYYKIIKYKLLYCSVIQIILFK